ncbi:C40 family peptidase [Saccharomonospora xinjiangensis]|uniref:C40 family peptidase n=1 Tax=Saccharomonospora xinjiangensis TaxID=75294 RepID=UPI00106F461C|nr:C40 family peptidase [Saccharomonospora xinjiangensis]QBQ59686.1 putative endopeptidase p60 precursor [Saccharomonospora xinjiangensis]
MARRTFARTAAVLVVGAVTLVATPSVGSAMMNQNAAGSGGGEPSSAAAKDRPKPGNHSGKSATPIGERIIDIAARQAGDPYVYGAEGPDQFDCSGLTQYVHARVGIDLPRTSRQQRAALPELPKSAMRPGDLLFFHEGGRVYHVGIFAGDGRMWAAPEPGDVVRLQNIWTESFTVGRAW